VSENQRVIETSILAELDDGGLKAFWVPTISNYVSNADLDAIRAMSLEIGMQGAAIISSFYLDKEVEKTVRDMVRSDLLTARPDHRRNISRLDAYISELAGLRSRAPSSDDEEEKLRAEIGSVETALEGLRQIVEPEEQYISGLVDSLSTEVCHHQSIVIERSPPSLDSLLGILKTGSGVAIGSWLGIEATSYYDPLVLFAAVPMGIIVCGAAAGISEGLQRGLKERIAKLVSPARAPRSRVR
jgi:hypothetical protein